MQKTDLEAHVGKFVKRCEKTPISERLMLRPEVDRVIRTLKSQHQAVPSKLRQLKAVLDDEAYDDMFDNMPI